MRMHINLCTYLREKVLVIHDQIEPRGDIHVFIAAPKLRLHKSTKRRNIIKKSE